MEATIEVRGLRKSFGATVALDGMTFTVAPGQVTGFVGPNGAGKSTTMRVILGLDAADAGTALVGGRRYASLPRPLTHLGSLLDAGAVQPSRTGRNHLLWLAHSQGLGAARVDAVLGQAGLGKAARRRAGGFSLGMRQRLGIAAALLGDPPVLMMDEPFNGMDPEGIVWMRGFLRSLAAAGRAVLVSSHLMSELEDTADHLVIVGRGKVIADTSTRDLLAAASGDRVTLRTTDADRAAAALTRAGATATADGTTVTVSGLAPEKVVLLLTENAVPFSEVSAHHASLEEAYLELTRDAVEYRAEDPPGPALRGVPGSRPPGPAPGPCDDRDDDARALGAKPRGGQQGQLRATGARRVDQVPHRARLGDRHGDRRGADRRGRAVRRVRATDRLPAGRSQRPHRPPSPLQAVQPGGAGR